jgi:hypothetical protein
MTEPLPPSIPAAPPRWTEVAARVAGAWILTGCLLKALLGTPGDLPPPIRAIPIPLGTLFSLVIGAEALTGLLALLRPGRYWPLAALVLVVFAGILVSDVAAGQESCGCLGGTLTMPPAVMLGIDLVVLAALLVSRPWRLARGGRGDVVAGLVALLAAAPLPFVLDREVKLDRLPTVAPGGTPKLDLSGYADLTVAGWKGKALKDTPLAKVLDLSDAQDGVWIFYRLSCQFCGDCLQFLSMFEQGAREVTLVLVPEKPGGAAHIHMRPRGSFVHEKVLPEGPDWQVNTPARLIVRDGQVVEAADGVLPDVCRPGDGR